jgi:sulfate/thiosulfate transport system ATP-binding protein
LSGASGANSPAPVGTELLAKKPSGKAGATGIVVDAVSKDFGTTKVLHDVTLEIAPGELLALLGPSGSGKTTLLRLIAGLEHETRGRIFMGERDAATMSLRERKVGFVFQGYALFRNMTVFDNIAFGLKIRPRSERPIRAAIADRVMGLLDRLQIQGLENRYPSQLSGGQRQRVAIARALAIDPTVLLLDEPFGALDAKVRKELRRWLREVCDLAKVTTVFVTHDQEEALELADRVAVMHQGRIEQVAEPALLVEDPKTAFVCSFLGDVNRFEGQVENGTVEILGTPFPIDRPIAVGSPVEAFVRPFELEVLNREHGHGTPAIVKAVYPFADTVTLELAVEGQKNPIEIRVTRELWEMGEIAKGQGIFIRPTNVRIYQI